MNSPSRSAVGFVLALALLGGACSPDGEGEEPRMSVGLRLSGEVTGYPKVTRPRAFRYPRDHGSHAEYKHEWWYITGQAATPDGRRFGFQLAIFREAVSPEPAGSASRWATRQIYLAHAAVTDVDGGRYLSAERFARGALGLAGASVAPLRVWLEDWELRGQASGRALEGRIAARSERFAFDLAIRSTRPPVAHGDRGLHTKGREGNASYYYSYTRMATRGTVRVDGESFEVAGHSWLDHEWSSSALAANQSGWDWFALQLSGGQALMVYRLRDQSTAARDFSSGTFVDASGEATTLPPGEISIEALGHWTSDRSGVRYPVRWRLAVPDRDLVVTVEPLLDEQEFMHSFRYWEGAVRVRGRLAGKQIRGQGYVELTGYSREAKR